jgi:hypothetical protein
MDNFLGTLKNLVKARRDASKMLASLAFTKFFKVPLFKAFSLSIVNCQLSITNDIESKNILLCHFLEV